MQMICSFRNSGGDCKETSCPHYKPHENSEGCSKPCKVSAAGDGVGTFCEEYKEKETKEIKPIDEKAKWRMA